ncbi:hypothetical protein BKA70DRAFT_1398664 [Coprinopsis sp. MPI-PUGE-AT-0042]|nr:hypothetical protein BKA70DRAFT_1398664 [Coprinopsis sp. MPI-PUGE-AT-0042]
MLPTSPFRERLGTNYVPSEDETIAIQKLIEAVEPQIVSLDAEIEALKQRRAIYASFVADHRALVSPIRHMPPDILRNIFHHSVPHSAPERAVQASEAPLLLVQICRHWRDLVIKTLTLWSTIFLKIPEPPQIHSYSNALPYGAVDAEEQGGIDFEAEGASEMESLIGATTTWLSRAEGCPLTIVFRDIYSPRVSNLDAALIHEQVDLLLSFICGRSSQWAELDLRVPESSSSERTLLSLSPSQTPHLRSIRVQWWAASGDPPNRPYSPGSRRSNSSSSTSTSNNDSDIGKIAAPNSLLHTFKAARLKHLYFENVSGNFKDIPVSWSNLTELSYNMTSDRCAYQYNGSGVPLGFSGGGIITNFTPSAALDLLQQCPNLVRCELHLSEFVGRGDHLDQAAVPTRVVHLPYLQRFVVSEQKQHSSLAFFKSLIYVPLLTSVSWTSRISQDAPYPYPGVIPTPTPHLSLYPLLATSGHQIQCLEFGAIVVSITQLVDCLKLAVGVTELTINMSNLISPANVVPFEEPTSEDAPPHVIMPQQWKPPQPFYRDKLLASLTPPSGLEVSAVESTTTTTICPNLAILKLDLGHQTNITTKALKNLVALRNSDSLGHSQDSIHRAVSLTQVIVRFWDLGHPTDYYNNNGKPQMSIFPKRWDEDQLNSDFSRHIIKVERPRTPSLYDPGMNGSYLRSEGARRRPFETYWDFESNRYG